MDSKPDECEHDLKATLTYLVKLLESGSESLSSYRHLNPKLQLICSALGMMQGLVTEARDCTDDILSELQGIPDNFTAILDDVNLLMSQSDDGTVNCTVVPIDDGFSLENAQTVSDKSVVAVLLKAFSLVRSGVLNREILFRTKVTALTSQAAATLDIPVTCEDTPCYLVLECVDREEYALSEMEEGKDYTRFRVVEKTDSHIVIEWLSPFVGVLKLEA
jgi:hypothetical protein